MKHLYNFKIFERKITIDFPDDIILNQFKELLEYYFEGEHFNNKEKLIDELVTKFAEKVIEDYLEPTGQGAESPELYQVLDGADGNEEEIEDAIFGLLSEREYREIISKYNKNYMTDHLIGKDAKKYNL